MGNADGRQPTESRPSRGHQRSDAAVPMIDARGTPNRHRDTLRAGLPGGVCEVGGQLDQFTEDVEPLAVGPRRFAGVAMTFRGQVPLLGGERGYGPVNLILLVE